MFIACAFNAGSRRSEIDSQTGAREDTSNETRVGGSYPLRTDVSHAYAGGAESFIFQAAQKPEGHSKAVAPHSRRSRRRGARVASVWTPPDVRACPRLIRSPPPTFLSFPFFSSYPCACAAHRPPTDIAMDVYLWQFCNEARTCHERERERKRMSSQPHRESFTSFRFTHLPRSRLCEAKGFLSKLH